MAVFFGVRHLSPAAAHHICKKLDEIKPDLVLIEGPSDLNDQMHWFCHPKTKLPAAILAYTEQAPIKTYFIHLQNIHQNIKRFYGQIKTKLLVVLWICHLMYF